MKEKWIIALLIIIVTMGFMFIFKELKYRFVTICIGSILVSLVTRNSDK